MSGIDFSARGMARKLDTSLSSQEAGLGLSLIGRPTVGGLISSNASPRGEGAKWYAGEVAYSEAAPGASDHHLTTAGGVKLYAEPNAHGCISASQLGCGQADDSAQLANLIACLTGDICRHLLIDTDITLPGANSGFSFDGTDIPNPATIEWIGEARVLYATNGASPHDYLKFDGITGLRLIAPHIKNTVTPTNRTSRPGIFLIDCDDCHTFDAVVEDTHGAGTLIENSRNCSHVRPSAYRTLADGHHITNGSTGPSINCWTHGAYSEDTGDDGVAVVSYDSGAAICENCGHLDFVVQGGDTRGATVVGLKGGKMRGIVRDVTTSQGFLALKDVSFNTFAPQDVDVDIATYGSGSAFNAAIEIGRAANGITGRLRAFDSTNRGVTIGSPSEDAANIAVELYSQGAGGTGLYCDGFDTLNISSFTSIGSGGTGSAFLNGHRLTVGQVNITEYGQDGGAFRGIEMVSVEDFSIGPGVIRDSTANSERPIRVATCTDGRIAPMIAEGGYALVKIQIVSSNDNVISGNPYVAAIGGTTATLDISWFGPKTFRQFTSGSAKTLTVPSNATDSLPIGETAHIINRGANDLTISGSGTFIGSATVASGSSARLVQIATDVWAVS